MIRIVMTAVAVLGLCVTAYGSASLSNGPPSGTLVATSSSPNNACNVAEMEIQEQVPNPSPPPNKIWKAVSQRRRFNTIEGSSGKKQPASSSWGPETKFKPPGSTSGRKFRLVIVWKNWTDSNNDGVIQESELSTQTTETSSTVTMP